MIRAERATGTVRVATTAAPTPASIAAAGCVGNCVDAAVTTSQPRHSNNDHEYVANGDLFYTSSQKL